MKDPRSPKNDANRKPGHSLPRFDGFFPEINYQQPIDILFILLDQISNAVETSSGIESTRDIHRGLQWSCLPGAWILLRCPHVPQRTDLH